MLPVLPVLIALACMLVSGCADSRLSRHFHAGPWRDGLAEQFERPQRFVPELAAASATVLLLATDEAGLASDEALDHEADSGDTSRADEVRDALRWTAVGWSAVSLLRGDDARAAEVGVEIWALNTVLTRGFKSLAGRERPNGSDDGSFPSGHASTAFSLATFLARSVDDAFESPWGKLGYLAYVPASFVAAHRVSSEVHFPSDVVAGALLGFFVANAVYDAHYGDGDAPSIFGGSSGDIAWGWAPTELDERVALCFFVSF
ncbi:MAG: phosphatase PAP2 family protein [Planctomycetes bacterium]|nr:phosphatase PAP2 family protein [Planctomycetota bacterium]